MMNLKTWTILFWLCIFSAGNVLAQNSAPILLDNTNGNSESSFKVGEVRGSIKRKAVLLPLPPFPREALEAGADGVVKVEIQIDAEGSVVSAKAISGNPLLFTAAEETAQHTKFRRVETTEQDFRETGFLNYNFFIEKASWLKIGYDLAIIQKAPTLSFFNVPRVAKAFQPDWTEEHKILGELTKMRRVDMEESNGTMTKSVFVRKQTQNGIFKNTIVGEIRLPIPAASTDERNALAQNLTVLLQSRLSINEADLWKFDVGVNIFRAFDMSRDPDQRGSAAQILRQFAETAPSDFSSESMAALQNLIKILERKRQTVETPDEFRQSLKILFKN